MGEMFLNAGDAVHERREAELLKRIAELEEQKKDLMEAIKPFAKVLYFAPQDQSLYSHAYKVYHTISEADHERNNRLRDGTKAQRPTTPTER